MMDSSQITKLIKQKHLTRMIVSDHHEYTEVFHLNILNIMHLRFKDLHRFNRCDSSEDKKTIVSFMDQSVKT